MSCNCSLLAQILTANGQTQSHTYLPRPTTTQVHHQQKQFTDEECLVSLRRLFFESNRELWRDWRQRPENIVNSDAYSIVMLSIFASIILCLMVRAIKPSETIDEQVTLLLSSMRSRIEIEDNFRRKQKMREAKMKAIRWLAEARQKSKQLSFRRNRSTSDTAASYNCRRSSEFLSPTFTSPASPTIDFYSMVSNCSVRNSHTSIKSTSINEFGQPPIATMRVRSVSQNLLANENEIYEDSNRPSACQSSSEIMFCYQSENGDLSPAEQHSGSSFQFLPEIVVTSTANRIELKRAPEIDESDFNGDESSSVYDNRTFTRPSSLTQNQSRGINFNKAADEPWA